MISTVVRSLLTRSAIKSTRQYVFASSAVTSKYFSNIAFGPHGQHRFFSVSARLASPAAAKATKTKRSTVSKASAKKSTASKKKTVASAAKRKTTTTTKKKAATKKRKAAAKKKTRVTTRRKAKKVAPKKLTPRTDVSLRAPPRSLGPFSLYVKRMWGTISPKPTSAPEGVAHLRVMWGALTPAEKQPFIDEVSVLNEQRHQDYDKWRAGLSLTQVRAINASRKNTKHWKLGPPRSDGAAKKPAKGFIKFYSEARKNGTVDVKKAPVGTRPTVYATREAAKIWNGMSAEQKKAYM